MSIEEVFFILVIEICVIVFVVWIAWSGLIGAPWLPTPRNKVRDMLEFADVNQEDVLYDLGSGDGRIIVMAAKEFGANSIGIEVDPLRMLWSRLAIKRHKLGQKVKVIRANFFNVSLEDASVVTLYQGHEINKKIRAKLASELRSGTRVVSYRFILDGWTPVKTNNDESIFLYVV
ncbi:MAG: class I SAM-dependent methyltransferase [Candidatus Sifarchaeia archaeon]